MSDLKWWQQAVFYQIYPRSFADGNGDGIGDFPGMTARLDYLHDLGIDAIWLSPHYPSPFLDCGYDISDYSAVGPEYGTLDDFTTFLQAAHERGIKVVLDLVLNHTSHLHPWFIESASSRDNPKRDWFVWCDGKEGGPPNNWASIFGGSAWEHDDATGQYYYHAFLKEQPDLNWRNAEVKAAMWDMVRFWLDLGVDGFRLDAIATVYEHPDLPDQTLVDNPEAIVDANALTMADYHLLMRYQIQQPGVHELMQELRALIDTYPGDRVLVGEDENVAFHGENNNELHLVFNFPLMRSPRLTPPHIRANQALRLSELPQGAWPCNTLGNHDSPRVWSRYGDGQNDAALARVHLALMLTLKGTPFLYNGEEIGMTNLSLSSLEEIRDTAALNLYRLMTEKLGRTPAEALAGAIANTRDRCRTPFQWNNAPNGGFCPPNAAPWLPANPNYADGVNAADQENDPDSLLWFYRRLLRLRRTTPALVSGDYHALDLYSEDYLAFLRHSDNLNQTCLVLLNMSEEPQQVLLDLGGRRATTIFSSQPANQGAALENDVQLAPFGVIIATAA